MKKCLVSTTIVFDKDHKNVILLNHKKLEVWMPPGGHIELGELPSEAALREAMEETGLKVKLLYTKKQVVKGDGNAIEVQSPFVVLNENVEYKDEPHLHFDMVYIAEAESKNAAMSHESTDMGWFDRKSIQQLKMFPNVRSVLEAAFKEFGSKE